MAVIRLSPDARSPRRARVFTRQRLEDWDVPAELVYDAEILVTETVTNAVRHAGTPIVLDVRQGSGGKIVIRVTDESGKLPEMKHPGPRSKGGRGLLIVNKISSSWKVDEHADGKVVEMILEPLSATVDS